MHCPDVFSYLGAYSWAGPPSTSFERNFGVFMIMIMTIIIRALPQGTYDLKLKVIFLG